MMSKTFQMTGRVSVSLLGQIFIKGDEMSNENLELWNPKEEILLRIQKQSRIFLKMRTWFNKEVENREDAILDMYQMPYLREWEWSHIYGGA